MFAEGGGQNLDMSRPRVRFSPILGQLPKNGKQVSSLLPANLDILTFDFTRKGIFLPARGSTFVHFVQICVLAGNQS